MTGVEAFKNIYDFKEFQMSKQKRKKKNCPDYKSWKNEI